MYLITVLYTDIKAPPTPNIKNISIKIGPVLNLSSMNFPIKKHPNINVIGTVLGLISTQIVIFVKNLLISKITRKGV